QITEIAIIVCPSCLAVQDGRRSWCKRNKVWFLVLGAGARKLNNAGLELRQLDRIGETFFRYNGRGKLGPSETCNLVGTLAGQHQQLDDRSEVIVAGVFPYQGELVVPKNALPRGLLEFVGTDNGVALDGVDPFLHRPGKEVGQA